VFAVRADGQQKRLRRWPRERSPKSPASRRFVAALAASRRLPPSSCHSPSVTVSAYSPSTMSRPVTDPTGAIARVNLAGHTVHDSVKPVS
jgi:hypothetical protein